jgi:hypothetical protein
MAWFEVSIYLGAAEDYRLVPYSGRPSVVWPLWIFLCHHLACWSRSILPPFRPLYYHSLAKLNVILGRICDTVTRPSKTHKYPRPHWAPLTSFFRPYHHSLPVRPVSMFSVPLLSVFRAIRRPYCLVYWLFDAILTCWSRVMGEYVRLSSCFM